MSAIGLNELNGLLSRACDELVTARERQHFAASAGDLDYVENILRAIQMTPSPAQLLPGVELIVAHASRSGIDLTVAAPSLLRLRELLNRRLQQ